MLSSSGNSVHPTVMSGSQEDLANGRFVQSSRYDSSVSLEINNGTQTSIGSGVLISPNFVVTAAHNFDFDNDGVLDHGLNSTSYFNPTQGDQFGVSIESINIHPDFAGFNTPNINDDLALVRLSNSVAKTIKPASWENGNIDLMPNTAFDMVGYGQSGSGETGYSIAASLSHKRWGANTIDAIFLDDEGGGFYETFQYDFDHPSTAGIVGGSLGDSIESTIGPGDSGGGIFIRTEGQDLLVGLSTFTVGSNDGRFGSRAGGIILAPYEDWISEIVYGQVPEPSEIALILGISCFLVRMVYGKGFR